MIACQKCGITEKARDGLRILPYWADEPESHRDWLTLCRPCFEGEAAERERHNTCCPNHRPLAVPAWEEARLPTSWHREILER